MNTKQFKIEGKRPDNKALERRKYIVITRIKEQIKLGRIKNPRGVVKGVVIYNQKNIWSKYTEKITVDIENKRVYYYEDYATAGDWSTDNKRLWVVNLTEEVKCLIREYQELVSN